jgi:hypothetical protein
LQGLRRRSSEKNVPCVGATGAGPGAGSAGLDVSSTVAGPGVVAGAGAAGAVVVSPPVVVVVAPSSALVVLFLRNSFFKKLFACFTVSGAVRTTYSG